MAWPLAAVARVAFKSFRPEAFRSPAAQRDAEDEQDAFRPRYRPNGPLPERTSGPCSRSGLGPKDQVVHRTPIAKGRSFLHSSLPYGRPYPLGTSLLMVQNPDEAVVFHNEMDRNANRQWHEKILCTIVLSEQRYLSQVLGPIA